MGGRVAGESGTSASTAGLPAYGAAIYNAGNGRVTIFGSLFWSNNVAGSAGGLGGPGRGVLGPRPSNNGASGAALGAAIANEAGTVIVVNSTFLANSGTGPTGSPAGAVILATDQGMGGGNGGSALGGAAFNYQGTLSFTNCTFAANSVLGGKGGSGGTGEPGGDGGRGGDALGAGIYTSSQGAALVVNCTFSDNSVTGGQGGEGGLGLGLVRNGDYGSPGNAGGGAIFNQGGTVHLRNSILANSFFGPNAGGTISDEGFNLSSDATPVLHATGSHNQIDPRLGSLQSGLAPPISLSAASPAIDAITISGDNGAPPFDQRMAFRVEPFDIGAFEAGGILLPPTLRAQRSGNAVVLSWPNFGSFALQMSKNLNSWIAVPDQPTTVNGVGTLRVVATNQASFYRLATP